MKKVSLYVRTCPLAMGMLWFIRSFYVWREFNNFWLNSSLFFCVFLFSVSLIPVLGPFLFLFLQPFYAIVFIISYARITSPKPLAITIGLFINYFRSAGEKMNYLGFIHLVVSSTWAWLIFYAISKTVGNNTGGGVVSLYQVLWLFAEIFLFLFVSYFYQQILVFATCLMTNVSISSSYGHLFKAIFFAAYAFKKNIKPFTLQAMLSIVLALIPVPFLMLFSITIQPSLRLLQLLYLIYCAYFFFPVYFGSLYEAYVTVLYHQKTQKPSGDIVEDDSET
ncbi:hypothetical protein [Candidatus Ichthyocystis hellenicum]|uniref:hypothetical protein n=1 Tax=Candidatus Ichthyocystis hellenicum TaxID=1561003 RepID=UPI000B8A3AFA|nr:hypothetical protein [Candidatus Ichthyocystis hellenicum]